MLIDWFTVVAQLLNFFVLVWLLKRFLYQPILNAIDAREQRIADELASAAAQQAEAKAQRDALALKNEAFEKQRAELLQRAEDDARTEHQRLLRAAREEAENLRAKREAALRNELGNLRRSLRQRTQREVFAIARKTLSDLASLSLEQCLIDLFARRLRELDATARAEFAAALTGEPQALVRTAFDIPPAQRDLLRHTLSTLFGIPLTLRFETAPDLITGIELSAQGKKLSWSIAGYLSAMEQALDTLLPAAPEQDAAAATTTRREPT